MAGSLGWVAHASGVADTTPSIPSLPHAGHLILLIAHLPVSGLSISFLLMLTSKSLRNIIFDVDLLTG